MGALTKEIPQIELKSVWDVIRLRWWILPITIAICVGLLFTQESSLQSEPSSVLVIATYGPRDELAGLSLYGIDPTSVQEFPSFQNQILAVQENASKAVTEQIGRSVEVTLSRPEQQVSLIAASDTSGKQKLTMINVGEPNYVLTCTDSSSEICDEAIQIYASQISKARADGINNGLQKLAEGAKRVLAVTQTPQPQLELQRTALVDISATVSGELQLASKVVEPRSATIATVKKSTYIFGAVAGLLIGLLVILQLMYTDDKIRSPRKLQSANGRTNFLGETSGGKSSAGSRQMVATLLTQIKLTGTSSVLLVPVDSKVEVQKLFELLGDDAKSNKLELIAGLPVDEMSVNQLMNRQETLVVLVALKNSSTFTDMTLTHDALVRSNNNIGGVLLMSSAS
jgi:hypothetical protein